VRSWGLSKDPYFLFPATIGRKHRTPVVLLRTQGPVTRSLTQARNRFTPCWVTLIMKCISTVMYLVIVNGQPVGNIRPSRGLQQGDPLSPYLFLLCVEVLSSQLNQVERIGLLRGVPTSPKGPCLNYLFFTDESLLFYKANINE
jgi:hypothetical protein